MKTILDLTYGKGLSWKDYENKEGRKIIKIDKNGGKGVIKINFCNYLKKALSENFDLIYYDPPFYVRDYVKNVDVNNGMLNKESEVFWSKKDFDIAKKILRGEVRRVLTENGVLIVKTMDGYVGSKYYPNVFDYFGVFNNLTPVGCFVCPIKRNDTYMRLVRVNHIYYLVFKKEKGEGV